MKFYEFITVVIVFVIILAVLLVGGQINKLNNIQDAYSSEKANNKISNEVNLEMENEDVQTIYPFTGAFPIKELAYLTKMKNVDRDNMTNEFILRTAFAKVTKEDWADSYTTEGEPLEIDAKLLEKYIEDVFGDVKYIHENFDNKDLVIDGADTSLYENEYNKKDDTYTINILAGDGVGESYILEHTVTAKKYGDKIEIIVKPIYVDNLGERENEDGEYHFYYKCYASYDFKTKKFENALTGEIEDSLYDDNYNNPEFIDEIKNIDQGDLETYILTYRLNGKTNHYEFESLKFEE